MTPSPLWKTIQTLLNITADGIPGPITLSHLANELVIDPSPPTWRHIQKHFSLKEDGIPGVKTAQAALLSLQRNHSDFNKITCPKESEVERYFGKAGEGLQLMDLPYPMKLAWDTNTIARKITCHSLVALPLTRIFQKTLNHYGLSRISALRLDLFGGCYNNRNKVGGSAKSMHAYGIAVDIDPDHNKLKWNKSKATLARADYDAFWNIVESENAVSLGREKNYDWMHFQFARI